MNSVVEHDTSRSAVGSAPVRMRLPDTRMSVTHKFSVGEVEGYVTVGFYEDGRPGEVFVKIAQHGSMISGLLDTIAVLTSTTLQYGVPVETLVHKFEFSRFEPSGWTKNPELRHVHSIVDYLFRWLGLQCSEAYRKERLDLLHNCPVGASTASGDDTTNNRD